MSQKVEFLGGPRDGYKKRFRGPLPPYYTFPVRRGGKLCFTKYILRRYADIDEAYTERLRQLTGLKVLGVTIQFFYVWEHFTPKGLRDE